MPRSSHDQAIVAPLLAQLTTLSTSQQEKRVKYNRQGRVCRLDLTGPGLTRLFPEVGQLSQLEWLNVSDNQLTHVPAELGQLSQLQELHLECNQLTSVPAELGQPSQLQNLSIADNSLSHFFCNKTQKVVCLRGTERAQVFKEGSDAPS